MDFTDQAMKPLGDKSARLQVATNYIKNGTVLFPRKGCEDLINQLINFGVESHDDLEWSYLPMCTFIIAEPREWPNVIYTVVS